MKRVAIAMLVVAAGSFLGGCNTISGFGKDVERAGQKVQGAVRN